MPSGVVGGDGRRMKGIDGNRETKKAQQKAQEDETIGEEGQGPGDILLKTWRGRDSKRESEVGK